MIHATIDGTVQLLVLLLATARLTRLFTSDWWGEWFVAGPIKRWAMTHDVWTEEAWRELTDNGSHEIDLHHGGWRSKLASGLDCSFCIGFWIGVVLLVLNYVPALHLADQLWWNLSLGALALNYVVGHLSSRAD